MGKMREFRRATREKLTPEQRRAVRENFEARLRTDQPGAEEGPTVPLNRELTAPRPNPWLMRIVAGSLIVAIAAALISMVLSVLG